MAQGNTLGTLTYTTDADGRRTLVGGTWARTSLPAAITTALYNANNQQTKVGTKTLTYDLNGNLTKDGNGNITYTWDARDRLTATSASNSTFQYDPFGRRAKKVISNTTTRFHYDGVNPVQELDNAGNVLANLLTGLGIDEPFTRSGGSGTRTLLGDALSSTLALADDAGTVQTTYTYEPFGTSTVTGQTNTNSYQYTGRENDGTGLDYYRARYYSPSRQRFINEDPIGIRAGVNFYQYAENNPLRWIDPLGLDITITWWHCCIGFDHVGIGVNTDATVGFYPLRPNRTVDSGVVAFDSERQLHPLEDYRGSFTIKTTQEQDRTIQDYINRRRTDPGRYNIFSGRHCGNFVLDALRAGGIDPIPDVASPRSIYQALKELHDAGVDFTQGVSRQQR